MKKLEQQVLAARRAARSAAARLAITDPRWVRPARMVIRLEDPVLGVSSGDGVQAPPVRFQEIVVSAVEWLGPVELRLLAGSRAASPAVRDLVRLAHRLECRVSLVTDGRGIDGPTAIDLVDRGLARARVLVGGVTDSVHSAVVGGTALEAAGAVLHLVAARRDRGAALDVEVAIPWRAPAETEAAAVFAWARKSGADGVVVLAPGRAAGPGGDPGALDAIAREPRPFHRTAASTFDAIRSMESEADGRPGRARRTGGEALVRCPAGGRRIEADSRGIACCCPFQEPIGPAGGSLADAWKNAGPHLRAIRGCPRVCGYDELVG